MSERDQFEVWLCDTYEWANDALNMAFFQGDDETGYYVGGDFIYDGASCSEPLFWAWRGWQAKASREALKAEQRGDGFMFVPVADLYELLHKGGEAYSYTSSASDAVYWVKEGYTVREYVLLDRLQDAINHPIDTTSQQYEALSKGESK